jgi:hypothetical protein
LYAWAVKKFATVRLSQATAKYAEHAPVATACCMTCRTCVTSNLLGLALVPVLAAAAGARRLARFFA